MLLSTIARLLQLIYHPSELASKLNSGNYPNFCVRSQPLKDGDYNSRETRSSVVPENEICLVPFVSSLRILETAFLVIKPSS